MGGNGTCRSSEMFDVDGAVFDWDYLKYLCVLTQRCAYMVCVKGGGCEAGGQGVHELRGGLLLLPQRMMGKGHVLLGNRRSMYSCVFVQGASHASRRAQLLAGSARGWPGAES